MKKNIAVILGDGIGPEVTQQSVKVLDAIARQFKHSFCYRYALMGADAIDKTGSPLPKGTLEACYSSDAILFGAIGHPKYDNPAAQVKPEQGLLQLQQHLGLYANIRPILSHSSLLHLSPLKSSRLENVDFIIVRDLTGGICAENKELTEGQTQASDDCVYHRDEIEKAAHLAFNYARRRKKALTLVDKANVLETSRLWRKSVQQIAVQYADVTVDYMLAENAAMQIITNPRHFDVILTDNLFGEIMSGVANVINGSPGISPAALLGEKYALFGPVHRSNPQVAGKNTANPVASILSAAMMLKHWGMNKEAALIREAVQWTLVNGFVTRDIDPINNYSTATIGDLVMDYVEDRIPSRINKENMVISKSTII